MKTMIDIIAILLGVAIGRLAHWLYFRIREWRIMKAYDGTSFIQVCKENLTRDH
jgi:hypothetical protein